LKAGRGFSLKAIADKVYATDAAIAFADLVLI